MDSIDNKPTPQNQEGIDVARAILAVDELSQFILEVYNSANASELGYEFLLSTMPTKIDDALFQRMLELSEKVPEKYKVTAKQVRDVLLSLREMHAAHPSVESYSLMVLTGDMIQSRYVSLDEMDNRF